MPLDISKVRYRCDNYMKRIQVVVSLQLKKSLNENLKATCEYKDPYKIGSRLLAFNLNKYFPSYVSYRYHFHYLMINDSILIIWQYPPPVLSRLNATLCLTLVHTQTYLHVKVLLHLATRKRFSICPLADLIQIICAHTL